MTQLTERQVTTTQRPQPHARSRVPRPAWYLVFPTVWGILVAFPLLWMLLGSLKTNQEIFASPLTLPLSWRWENYPRVLVEEGLGTSFVNSAIVVALVVPGSVLIGAMAAYVLGRMRFRGNTTITWVFVGGMTVPLLLGIVPLFALLNRLGLINSLWGYVAVLIAYQLPFTIYLLHPFFATIPDAMEESAIMDGCSRVRTFWHVMLPLATPGLGAAAVFNFIYVWNEYTLALVILNEDSVRTLPVAVGRLMFRSQFLIDWGVLFAGLVVSVAPPLLAYVALRKRLSEGFRVGAVKG